MRAVGAGPDPIARLDVAARMDGVLERLDALADRGLFEVTPALRDLVAGTPRTWRAPAPTLVHGDLDGRHLLVNDDGELCGVIDWGDVHLGDPTADLAAVHAFISPAAHPAFRSLYEAERGPVDPAAWAAARFRAISTATWLVLYGTDQGHEAMVREAHGTLSRLTPH